MNKSQVPISILIEQDVAYLERDGHTLVFVAIDSQLVAALAIHDPLKDDAKQAVGIIKHMKKKVTNYVITVLCNKHLISRYCY